MKNKIKKILKLLFPEYQIRECIKERGFIEISPKKKNFVKKNYKTYSYENIQQMTSDTSEMEAQNDLSLIKQNNNLQRKTHTSQKENEKVINRSNNVFNDLSDELKKYWVGSQKDRDMICRAFQRPFIKGFNNIIPKNAILLLGSESRGKVYAIRCISEILKQQKIFKYNQIIKINMSDYVSDSSNTLFLSDVYKALNIDTESIIFENVEKSTVSQLDIIYQLLTEGTYKLTKRYMINNGTLVDATSTLNTDLVSKIASNGKYFVFTSILSQSKIISILGNRFIKEIGDIITLDLITDNQIDDLAYTLCINLKEKCKENLHINLEFDDLIISIIGQRYNSKIGVKGLKKHIEEQIYEPLSEMKLQKVLLENENIKLTYTEGYCIISKNEELITISKYIKNYNTMGLNEIKNELEKVIGLAEVKNYVLNLETNFKVQKIREKKGLKTTDISMHMIFTGNPGTGKTTIARIVAKYLKAIGILSSGHLCEVTRADLVGQYVGHTAIKTTELINDAIGGVLFIDEAYSLCRNKDDTFGLEAIDALVKGMEDNRDNLVVILAGYKKEMNEFLKLNSGLKSRFPNIVHFKDYTVEEMYEIAKITANSKGYHIDEECKERLIHEFERHQIKGKNDTGNGRLVRNLIEAAVLNQAQRIIQNPNNNLETLILSDFGFEEIKEFNLEESLSEVIGLKSVKDIIKTQYALLQANKMRKNANYVVDTSQSLNMIFAGNPGTGKTTIARIVAKLFHSMGILKSGQLIEVDRSNLIAEYVGQTAKKTEEVFKSALGGVLFIDEAYAIINNGDSFGQECIDTLVKLIEDYHGELVVILAGYTKEMKKFMKTNSGLESRFPLFVEFPDYSADELHDISIKMIEAKGFKLENDSMEILKNEIIDKKRQGGENFGNGRMVRNLVEDIIRRQSLRIAASNVPLTDLAVISPVDIKPLFSTNKNNFNLETELSKIIGLESVKKYIRSLNARLKLQMERKKAGLKADNIQTMHMIFTGNPGTGKTMMARIIVKLLYNMNIISSDKLIETERSELVAGYVGQTAIKTKEVIETALGGVLFIDEAYSLAQGGENDFGQEAINTLVKMMDDNRDRLIVILAGYDDDMKYFLDKNIGLHSRFPNIINFPDYTTDELMQIAHSFYSEQGYILNESGKLVLKKNIDTAKNNKYFGNGRYIRNIFERSLNNQALRLNNEIEYSKETLMTITDEDIKEV